MKRIFSICLAIGLFACMSVSSFAALDYTNAFFEDSPFLSVEGEVTFFSTIDTLSSSDAVREYMVDFFSVFTGETTSEDYYYLFSENTTKPYVSTLHFIKSSSILNVSYYNGTDASYTNRLFFFALSGNDFQQYYYITNTPVALYKPIGDSVSSKSHVIIGDPTTSAYPTKTGARNSCLLWSNHGTPLTFEPVSANSASNPFPVACIAAKPDMLKATYTGLLGLKDNANMIGSASGSEDVEPTPDIPVEPVEPAPDIPVKPVVPSDDIPIKLPEIDYNPATVGYDLAIWDNLLLTIFPTLRKVFSIILVLFAVMLGFKLFISIVPWLIMGWFRNEKGWYDKKTLVEHVNETSSISEVHHYNHRS